MASTDTRKIPFYRHDLGEPEVRAFEAALQDPIITTGKVTADFEGRFSDYLGTKHALAVTSCTGAMHMALMALDIGAGDEVITTPMTFIATATAILEAGAKPVFVDVEPDTGNIDVECIEAAITPKTKAILPVHLYGMMVDMRAVRAVADQHKLAVIEDAAHCVEGSRDGVRPGQLSDAACFSFYATKNLTCGEGGAIATNKSTLHEQLRLIRLHGMTKTAYDRSEEGYTHWDMVRMGWKYNLSNLDASILLPQMDRLNANLEKRAERAGLYRSLLAPIKGIAVQGERPDSVNARHVFNIWIRAASRDLVIGELRERGIESVVNYRAIHLHKYFRDTGGYKEGDFPIAEELGDSTISVPFYPTMPLEHIHTVCSALEEIVPA
ncbi:MAG: DegT/DnrJ/EryC1/StrS family aminotransferase [Rhodospirillaceae bacterium]|nr:DegT/DnrJ/EryC1/StrS family aminotransferase [Rhodospirillaceae bacterium]